MDDVTQRLCLMASHIPSVSLSLLLCKKGVTAPPSQGCLQSDRHVQRARYLLVIVIAPGGYAVIDPSNYYYWTFRLFLVFCFLNNAKTHVFICKYFNTSPVIFLEKKPRKI